MDAYAGAMRGAVLIVALLIAVPALGQDYDATLQTYRQRLTEATAQRAGLTEQAKQLDRTVAQLEGAIGAATELQKQAQQAAAQAEAEAAGTSAADEAETAEVVE